MLRKVVVCDGYVYHFTERECEIIEKYFDSIRLFMDDEIVDNIIMIIIYAKIIMMKKLNFHKSCSMNLV